MSKIQQSSKLLFDYVYLAEASYADFSSAYDYESGKYELEKVKKAIKDKGKQPLELAEIVVENYDVVAHYTDRDKGWNGGITGIGDIANKESGFSATLFRGKDSGTNPGKYVLAFKGTDGWKDLVVADGKHIVGNGLAHHQIVELYNFWQQLNTDKGKAYKAAKYEKDKELTDKYFNFIKNEKYLEANVLEEDLTNKGYLVHDGIVYELKLGDSDDLYSDERAYGLADDKHPAPTSVTLAGHSLGGHLATAFSRLFPEVTEHAYLFNGAGYGSEDSLVAKDEKLNVDNLFSQLGGENSFTASKITNVTGDKGMDLVANDWGWGLNQQGSQPEIFIEYLDARDNVLGHGLNQIADTMAVIDLFMRIDKSLQDKPISEVLELLNPVFRAMSKDDATTIEDIVNALGDLYQDGGKKVEVGVRADLYARLTALQNVEAIKNSTASLVTDISKIIELASNSGETGIAARYSLKNLLPFAIKGNESIYDSFNTNGELDLFDSKDNPNGMTVEYIKYRSDMLIAFCNKNTKGQSLGDYTFKDLEKDLIVPSYIFKKIGNADHFEKKVLAPLVIFGTDEDDIKDLNGKDTDDIIFGGGGDDTIDGGKGNDHMEGGTGFDTYLINTGDGVDTIFDSDGLGEILFNGKALSGGRRKKLGDSSAHGLSNGADFWVGDYGFVYYLSDGKTKGAYNLHITNSKEHLVINDWTTHADGSGGGLGIELSQDKNFIKFKNKITGDMKNNEIVGKGDQNELHGQGGSDEISVDGNKSLATGGDGCDVLIANYEGVCLYGGTGNDLLISSGDVVGYDEDDEYFKYSNVSILYKGKNITLILLIVICMDTITTLVSVVFVSVEI